MAIVAVTLSLVSFGWTIGWSIWQHRRTTSPQLDVRGSFAVLGLEPPVHAFEIRAANTGLVPATVTNAFAEVEGASRHCVFARYFMQTPGNLSRVIPSGEHWSGLLRVEDFREAIHELAGTRPPPWRVTVGVTDAAGKTYRSKPIEVRRGD